MRGQFKLAICALFLVAITALPSISAFAYVSQPRTIAEVASTADAIVVGRVRSISDGEKLVSEGAAWKLRLIGKHAVLDVYRAYPSMQDLQMSKDSELSIDYLSLDDWEVNYMRFGIAPIPWFPSVNVGDIYAFPMRRSSDDPRRLVVLNELNSTYPIPAVKKRIPDAKSDNALDFIHSELAGTFAYGDYEGIYRGMVYLTEYGSPDLLLSLIEGNVKGRSQWFDIAVATYCMDCGGGNPCPKITELDTFIWPSYRKRMGEFANMALKRASPENLEKEFVGTVIQRTDGSAAALMGNDQYNSTINRLLTDELNSDRSLNMKLRLAASLINNHRLADATIKATVKASKRFLADNPDVGMQDVWDTFRLISSYGNDDDFSAIVYVIQRAATPDSTRFGGLWKIAMADHPSKQRMISLCKALIDNRGDDTPYLRYCDFAVEALQKVTGEDFGFDSSQIIFLRNRAVRKAKEWLASNLNKAT